MWRWPEFVHFLRLMADSAVPVGFLAVDKPGGITSHDVVAGCRRAVGIRKVGHAGTLDPMATGLVVVALGKATRLIRYVQDQPKEYYAVAQFGVATDSLDADGSVIAREPMAVDREELERVACRFVGTVIQVPPMVSALKVEGRRLYDLAREGTEVERAARPVEVLELEIGEVSPGPYPEVAFRVVCGKGTYVRALADDMAAAMGGRAHLVSLRRTRTGCLSLERHGVGFDELAELWKDRLLSPADALADLPAVTVDHETARGVANGVRFVRALAGAIAEGSPLRILDQDGGLLAIYRVRESSVVPEVVVG